MLLRSSFLVLMLPMLGVLTPSLPSMAEQDPTEVLRSLVQANEERDLRGMAALLAQDDDIISYGILGRTYVGWSALARDLQQEFDSVSRLAIEIKQLQVWKKGETAWFAMELDYRRFEGNLPPQLLTLRETGVLERRHGSWVVVSWHESMRGPSVLERVNQPLSGDQAQGGYTSVPDLSGEWDVQEDERSYRATLDRLGNGPYSWQGGRIVTTRVAGRTWQGTWQQPGNDREGGFELLLSEDGNEARGVWWYTRVGERRNIPPRQHGGTYLWKRITPAPAQAR